VLNIQTFRWRKVMAVFFVVIISKYMQAVMMGI